jgi:hypothetical protein
MHGESESFLLLFVFLTFAFQRQMEPWKQEEDLRDALLEKRVGQEGGDAMKELENKTLDSKMEMDILDGLDEIKEWFFSCCYRV